ncbi:MAG TPA: ABC transporter permease [Solirubrobacterales bacterium]|nr:ABC transporter permease [Solirubrobacterales bacterium]
MSTASAETPVAAAPAAAPELREVRGPSSLGGGWRRMFSLLWLMSVTEFKRTYFGTVLGYLWSLVRPLMLFGVLLFVFTQIFRIGSDVPNYPVLLLLGIVLFSFFSEATQNGVTAVVTQEGIVRKTQFPRLVIPLSVVLTGIFNLSLNLLVVFVFILAWGVDPEWTWLLFPVALVLLFAFTAGIAMMLSALYVRFRDVAIIWSVLSSVLFYGTPILYPIEIVPDEFQSLLMINPLAVIFEQVRVWVLDPTAPTAAEAAGGALGLLPAAAIFVAACVLGIWAFNREAPRIAEEL